MGAPEHLRWLRFTAYGLYHVDSLAQSARGAYLYDCVPTFTTRFTTVQQQSIISAIEWALTSPDPICWEDVLPGLPHSEEFKREHLRQTRQRLLGSVRQPFARSTEDLQ